MFTSFSIEILIVVTTVGLVIAMLTLLVMQIKNTVQMNKLTYPAYEYVVRKAEHEADAIIAKAQEEARGIVAAAEKSGQETLQTYQKQGEDAHRAHTARLDEIMEEQSQQLANMSSKSIAQLESAAEAASTSLQAQQTAVSSRFDASLRSVETLSGVLESKTADAVEHIQHTVASIGEKISEKLEAESADMREHIAAHLTKAMAAAEADIAQYQKSRIALLDTHIERLVEDVTRTVLHKELTLQEHAELARTALAEAKEHNVL